MFNISWTSLLIVCIIVHLHVFCFLSLTHVLHILPLDLDKIQQIVEEERALKEENVKLQRRLQREKQRREDLTRQLSESESSLEMEDER